MKAFTSRHVLKSVSTFLNCIPKLVQKLGVQNEEMKESTGKEKNDTTTQPCTQLDFLYVKQMI